MGQAQRGLTPRSSGAPTAGHQARAGGTRYIFTGPGLASYRCRPLSSNVRAQNTEHTVFPPQLVSDRGSNTREPPVPRLQDGQIERRGRTFPSRQFSVQGRRPAVVTSATNRSRRDWAIVGVGKAKLAEIISQVLWRFKSESVGQGRFAAPCCAGQSVLGPPQGRRLRWPTDVYGQ